MNVNYAINKKNWKKVLTVIFSAIMVLCLVSIPTQVQAIGINDETKSPQAIAKKIYSEEEKIYGIGSISKIFPPLAIMQLVEEGKMDLDAPLTRYIPEFKMADERYVSITPRMLLDHSSGLMSTSDQNAMLLGERDTYAHDTFLKQLETQRLKAAPGSFSVYSNDGFTLAEILVERVSGLSFTDYIEQNISAKLNLQNTKTPNSNFDRAQRAKVYYNNSNMELPPEYLNEIGAGGILSTAADMCRFGQVFTRQGSNILSQKSVKEMETAQINNPFFPYKGDGRFEYGLGWDSVSVGPFDSYGIKAVGKGGDTSVYHGNLTVLPEENMTAVVLSSGGSSMLNSILVQEMLLSALEQSGRIDIKPSASTPALKQATPKEFRSYEGYYMSFGLLKVRFDDDGHLYISTLDERRNVTQEYLPTEDNRFISTNGDYISNEYKLVSAEGGAKGKTYISFNEGSNGESYLSVSTYETQPGLGELTYTIPFAQKVENNLLSESVKVAWKEREGKKYYLISEKASSSGYLEPATTIRLPKEGDGYFRNSKIVDEDNALAFVEIPIMLGRDLLDYHFYSEDSKNYLEYNNGGREPLSLKRRYLSEEDMENLPNKAFSRSFTSQETAIWYTIPKNLTGKTISIELLEGAEYFVYDSRDMLYASSIVEGSSQNVRLPKNGKLLLVGTAGGTFKIEE